MLILISTSEEAKPDTCYLLNIFILYLFNYLRFENKIKYLLLTRESNSIIYSGIFYEVIKLAALASIDVILDKMRNLIIIKIW